MHGSSTSSQSRGLSWPGLPEDTRLQVTLDEGALLVVAPPRGLSLYALFCLPLGVAGALIGSTAARQVLEGGGATSVLLLLFGSFVVLFALLALFEQIVQTKRFGVSREGVRLYRSVRDDEGVLLDDGSGHELLLSCVSPAEAQALGDLLDLARTGRTPLD